ncbi:hypothetical protein DFH28DRAFT_895021 [Melampsora americana]|nr:hypothetical protein DFH28DRAFT_895021 [Melampsora americana]
MSHPNSNSNPNSSDLLPTPSSPPQSIQPSSNQPKQPSQPSQPSQPQPALPSASLILKQTNKLNPRLPRPSNLAHSTIPSYAYGAAPTLTESPDQSSNHRRHTHRQSVSTHTDPILENRTPQPISTNSSNTTSVMIASAFERARWAARANEALSLNQTQSQRPQDPSPPPVSPSSANQQNIKKRRKSRKSFDPSYKYKPGDSATSDSEAGEGIADKRDRREKKLAAEAAAAAAVASGHQTSATKQTNKRRRRTTNQHDSETDSEEEGGEGIALTRGRRVIKVPTPFDNSNSKPARKRKAPNPKSRNGTSNRGSETESNTGTNSLNRSTRRRTDSNRGTSDGNRTDDQTSTSLSKPTATFYLEHPDSPESSRMPIEEDHTMGTTDDSRFTLGPGAESYEYEEEERIVKALEEEERAHRRNEEEEEENSHELDPSLSLENSNQTSNLNRRSLSSSHQSDSYQRSDSGLIEIEQVIATSKLQSQPKPRKLHIKPSNNLITPIEELDETRISSPQSHPSSTIKQNHNPVGFGTSLGAKLLRQISKISKYSSSFYWKLAILIFFLALIIS